MYFCLPATDLGGWPKICHACAQVSLHAPPITGLGCMDELTTAEAVTVMPIDGYAEEGSAQHTSCVAATHAEAQPSALEIIKTDKESNSVDAARHAVEDARVKVLNVFTVPSNSPSEQHLARAMRSHAYVQYVPETLRSSLSRNDDALRCYLRMGAAAQFQVNYPTSSKVCRLSRTRILPSHNSQLSTK